MKHLYFLLLVFFLSFPQSSQAYTWYASIEGILFRDGLSFGKQKDVLKDLDFNLDKAKLKDYDVMTSLKLGMKLGSSLFGVMYTRYPLYIWNAIDQIDLTEIAGIVNSEDYDFSSTSYGIFYRHTFPSFSISYFSPYVEANLIKGEYVIQETDEDLSHIFKENFLTIHVGVEGVFLGSILISGALGGIVQKQNFEKTIKGKKEGDLITSQDINMSMKVEAAVVF